MAGAAGQVKGRLDVAGTLNAPQGQLGMQGSQLAFQGNQLKTLSVNARLDNAQRANVDIKGNGIQVGDKQLGTLIVDAQGDIKRQQMKLDLQGPLLKLALGLDGNLDKGNWRGRLSSGDVQTGGNAGNCSSRRAGASG